MVCGCVKELSWITGITSVKVLNKVVISFKTHRRHRRSGHLFKNVTLHFSVISHIWTWLHHKNLWYWPSVIMYKQLYLQYGWRSSLLLYWQCYRPICLPRFYTLSTKALMSTCISLAFMSEPTNPVFALIVTRCQEKEKRKTSPRYLDPLPLYSKPLQAVTTLNLSLMRFYIPIFTLPPNHICESAFYVKIMMNLENQTYTLDLNQQGLF